MLEQQMSGRQELPEQLHRIGKQILLLSRNELYLKMRFLDVALSSCPFVLDEGIGTIGTWCFMVYLSIWRAGEGGTRGFTALPVISRRSQS